ncbi:9543_t:CDS:2, partial [Gigaspora margarita]
MDLVEFKWSGDKDIDDFLKAYQHFQWFPFENLKDVNMIRQDKTLSEYDSKDDILRKLLFEYLLNDVTDFDVADDIVIWRKERILKLDDSKILDKSSSIYRQFEYADSKKKDSEDKVLDGIKKCPENIYYKSIIRR